MRAVAAIQLFASQVPLLFMGEEWAASTPFPYFCDIEDELAEAVRQGRKDEVAHAADAAGEVPDPTAPATFRSAKFDWTERERGPHADALSWYRSILAVRHACIVPILPSIAGGAGSFECFDRAGLAVAWTAGDRTLRLMTNLSEVPVERATRDDAVIWREDPSDAHGLGAWSVVWTLA